MRRAFLVLCACLGMPVGAQPAPNHIIVVGPARPYRALPVPDAQLATMRGGLRLPNGLDLSLGIDIQTWIDGLLAVHTVYASDGVSPGIRVYTDGANPVRTAPATQTITSTTSITPPVLTVDRTPTGTTILPANATVAATVNLVNGDPSTWLSGENQTQLPVTRDGPPVATPQGEVSLQDQPDGAIVVLKAPDLEVRQLIGRATGVVVANTADNRAIDTVSAINVDLRGLTPGLLSGQFMAQRAAFDMVLAR